MGRGGHQQEDNTVWFTGRAEPNQKSAGGVWGVASRAEPMRGQGSRGSEPPVKGCLLWGLTDRRVCAWLSVSTSVCVCVCVCVCMRACALPTSLEGVELFPRQGESRLAYPPLQDPSPPHDLAHDGGQHARQHMRMCMHIHTLCP